MFTACFRDLKTPHDSRTGAVSLFETWQTAPLNLTPVSDYFFCNTFFLATSQTRFNTSIRISGIWLWTVCCINTEKVWMSALTSFLPLLIQRWMSRNKANTTWNRLLIHVCNWLFFLQVPVISLHVNIKLSSAVLGSGLNNEPSPWFPCFGIVSESCC